MYRVIWRSRDQGLLPVELFSQIYHFFYFVIREFSRKSKRVRFCCYLSWNNRKLYFHRFYEWFDGYFSITFILIAIKPCIFGNLLFLNFKNMCWYLSKRIFQNKSNMKYTLFFVILFIFLFNILYSRFVRKSPQGRKNYLLDYFIGIAI